MNYSKIFPLLSIVLISLFMSINPALCTAPTMSNYVGNNFILYGVQNSCSVEYYDFEGWNNVTSVDVQFYTFNDVETVTLRWTPTDGFSENSDSSGICSSVSGSFSQVGLKGGVVTFYWKFSDCEYGSGDYKFTVTDKTSNVSTNWIYDRIFVWDETVGDLLIIWKSTQSKGYDSDVDTSYWSDDDDHIRNWDYSTDFEPLDMIAESDAVDDTLTPTSSVNTNIVYIWNENYSSWKFTYLESYSWNPTDYDYSFSSSSPVYAEKTGGEDIIHTGLTLNNNPTSAISSTSSVNTNDVYIWNENYSSWKFTGLQFYSWNPTDYNYSFNDTSPEYEQYYSGELIDNLGLLLPSVPVLPEFYAVSINGVFLNETNPFGFWIFRADVYEMKVYTASTTFANITLSDTQHTIVFSYDTSTDEGEITVTGFSNPNQNMNVIGLVSSSYTRDAQNLTNYTFKFIPNNNIVDANNMTLYHDVGNGLATISGESTTKIYIYNLGGAVEYTVIGDGHHIVGGDVFELGATDGETNSSATASAIYRKLQHTHMLVDWYFAPDVIDGNHLDSISSGGTLEYKIEYAIDGLWVEGWKCTITPVDSRVGNYGDIGFDAYDSSWVKLYVQWYNQGVLIKSEYVMSYNFAYDTATATYFPTNRPTVSLWVDLWFNRMNSSSVVGGRVNAEYHGMVEESGWWFSSNFRPIYTNVTSSMFFTNLKDEFGDDMSCFGLDLIKVSCTLTKHNVSVTNGNLWKTNPYQIFDIKVSGDRMEGINTPVFVEPKPISIPSVGFFAPVINAIGSIATAIFVSALGFMRVLIGSVDTFLTIFGVPSGTFSSLIGMVTGTLLTVMGWFTIAVTQLQNMLMLFGALITNMTTLVNYAVNVLLWTFTNVFTMPLQVIALLLAVINGTSITFYGILLDFTPYASLMAGAKQILPLTIGIALLSYIIYGNMSLDGDEDMANAPKRVIGLFMGLKDTFDGIFWMYNRIRAIIMNMISAIKAWIPSMSGGMPSGENTV